MKTKTAIVCGLGVFLVSALPAAAHTAWFEKVEGQKDVYEVFFGGHEGKLEDYPAEKVKTVTAYDADGKTVAVERMMEGDKVRIQIALPVSLITMHFDNGIYTRTTDGDSVNKPMTDVEGALTGVDAKKYHKTIANWSEMVTKPVGQPFEVVPLSGTAPRAGEPMKVRILIDGKPASGIGIGVGEDTEDGKTDADGVAVFTPKAGFNKLWAGKRTPVENNPRYTELSIEYLLTFEAE